MLGSVVVMLGSVAGEPVAAWAGLRLRENMLGSGLWCGDFVEVCRDPVNPPELTKTISHFFGYLNLFSPLRNNNLESALSCFRHIPQRNMRQNPMSTPSKPAFEHYRNRLKPLRGAACGDLGGGRLI